MTSDALRWAVGTMGVLLVGPPLQAGNLQRRAN